MVNKITGVKLYKVRKFVYVRKAKGYAKTLLSNLHDRQVLKQWMTNVLGVLTNRQKINFLVFFGVFPLFQSWISLQKLNYRCQAVQGMFMYSYRLYQLLSQQPS